MYPTLPLPLSPTLPLSLAPVPYTYPSLLLLPQSLAAAYVSYPTPTPVP